MVKVFVVNANDSISVSEGEPGAPKRESKMPEIVKKLADANFSAAEVRRLITEEVALLVKEMGEYEHDATLASRVKGCTAQINALSVLEKALQKAERHDDVLIFDTPQFRFAFGRIVGMLKKAIQQGSESNHETRIQSIMKDFRYEVTMNEQELRRQTAKFPRSGSVRGSWTDSI